MFCSFLFYVLFEANSLIYNIILHTKEKDIVVYAYCNQKCRTLLLALSNNRSWWLHCVCTAQFCSSSHTFNTYCYLLLFHSPLNQLYPEEI